MTDGNGDKHYVECMGCALKLLKTYDTLHIETFCDWYGPDYKITIDISEKGTITTVNPSTALVLSGGGCTGNRVAYNQTAADALLINGYSPYTMVMMQQALPSNTNVTTISARALTFALGQQAKTAEVPAMLIYVGVAGIALVIIVSAILIKKKHIDKVKT